MVTEDRAAGFCRACNSYRSTITTLRHAAQIAASRASAAHAQANGLPSVRVERLLDEARRLKDVARGNELRLAQHRADMHSVTA